MQNKGFVKIFADPCMLVLSFVFFRDSLSHE